jgi:hypothetical protein
MLELVKILELLGMIIFCIVKRTLTLELGVECYGLDMISSVVMWEVEEPFNRWRLVGDHWGHCSYKELMYFFMGLCSFLKRVVIKRASSCHVISPHHARSHHCDAICREAFARVKWKVARCPRTSMFLSYISPFCWCISQPQAFC